MCAQHGRDLEVKVLWGTRSQGPRANRKAKKPARAGPTARSAPKEAGSEAASRRTGSAPSMKAGRDGYEAAPTRASGQRTAKLSRPRGGDVDPAVAR